MKLLVRAGYRAPFVSRSILKDSWFEAGADEVSDLIQEGGVHRHAEHGVDEIVEAVVRHL